MAYLELRDMRFDRDLLRCRVDALLEALNDIDSRIGHYSRYSEMKVDATALSLLSQTANDVRVALLTDQKIALAPRKPWAK